MTKSMKAICSSCGAYYSRKRLEAGFNTCLDCGETQASRVKHTIAPMHKSNNVVISAKADLKGINSKGGFYR